MSNGRNATILMDPDYVLGKRSSTAKPNVGIFAANGYQCYPPSFKNGPRPANVKRLSMPVNRPLAPASSAPLMPSLKGRSASTPQLPSCAPGDRRVSAPVGLRAQAGAAKVQVGPSSMKRAIQSVDESFGDDPPSEACHVAIWKVRSASFQPCGPSRGRRSQQFPSTVEGELQQLVLSVGWPPRLMVSWGSLEYLGGLLQALH
eukprot:CAMPEP_0114650930 /NCGR_PEP_ID=MMETSP0191-20121206/7992_1 /TAXON_ID=126664 /ORGANISM="Sorites sp." /LENGTH=202 /DNA_ID=CAMNT_0001864949 /DNA_START=98 /DNA_END=707 /DNA_ORIENTATION=+